MDAAAIFKLFSELVGGLGIFLIGMRFMSDGMRAASGESLRRLIETVTNHRLLAVGVGTFVTCVWQSSSITTVMIVGLVNGGLMTLVQAMGVIMGANIGTTITGWILFLKIGKYGLPMLGVGALWWLFTRPGKKSQAWAQVLLGVGMVFFGLELMRGACSLMRDTPQFLAWFQRFQADSYLGVWQCVLAGCVTTMIVQSSSATLGITVSLASQGVISFPTAAALVLGENIGTTITALLASVGANANARRAAYFHVIFNVIGVLWITAIFGWYIKWVTWILAIDPTHVVSVSGKPSYPDTTAGIAAAHTVFNVANVLLFLPFIHTISTWMEKPEHTEL